MQLVSLGVITGGAVNMAGVHSGSVTRPQEACSYPTFPVCCRYHQLDFVVFHECSQKIKDTLYSKLKGLVGHLSCQVNLWVFMKYTCPTFTTTWWMSLGTACKWLTTHAIKVLEHLQTVCLLKPIEELSASFSFLGPLKSLQALANVATGD